MVTVRSFSFVIDDILFLTDKFPRVNGIRNSCEIIFLYSLLEGLVGVKNILKIIEINLYFFGHR